MHFHKVGGRETVNRKNVQSWCSSSSTILLSLIIRIIILITILSPVLPVLSKKVHFFASYPGQLTGKVNRVKYSKVLVNVGRGFSRRTGVFRAPVKGVYQFFFSTQTANAGLKTDLWLVVNGYWVAVSRTHISRPSTVGSLSTYMTFLRRGAVVYVTHNCGRSWANAASMTITFGGSLLAQFK